MQRTWRNTNYNGPNFESNYPRRAPCLDEVFDEDRHPYDERGNLKSLEDLELWRKRLYAKIKEAMADDPSSLFVTKKTKFYDGLKAYISKRRLDDGLDERQCEKRNRAWLEREAKEQNDSYEAFRVLECNEKLTPEETLPKKKRTPSDWEKKE